MLPILKGLRRVAVNNMMYDILVVGGGCAGLTASIYGARAGMSVLVIEGSSIGGQISSSPKVENYPGFKEISGMEFSDRLYEQAMALGVTLEFDTVLNSKRLPEGGFRLIGEYGTYEGRVLIIATGAKHRHLGVPGEEELSGKGVSYCAVCDGPIYKGKTVAVIGGGSNALQSADFLSDCCEKVYLIHRRDRFRGEDVLIDRIGEKANVNLLLSCVVESFVGEDELEAITVKSLYDGTGGKVPVDGAFVAIGQEPENEIFRGLVDLDENGYIVAGEDCRTSADGIWCAGDCRTKSVRQLSTAAADGAVAALAAAEYCRKL